MKIRQILMAAVVFAALTPAAAQAQVEVRVVHRGMLGVLTESVESADQPRQRVLEVVPGSPAARAGVQRGDIVVALNGAPASDDVMRSPLAPGDTVVMRLLRDGTQHEYSIVVAERGRTMEAYAPRVRVLSDSVLREMAVVMENVRAEVDTLFFTGEDGRRVRTRGNITITIGGDSARVIRVDGDTMRVFRPANSFEWLRLDPDSMRAMWPDSVRALWAIRGDSMRAAWFTNSDFPGLPADFAMRMRRLPADSARTFMLEAFGDMHTFGPDSVRVVRPGEIFASGLTIGMRAVAGAELSDLNPDLAEYFGVAGGVLVLNAREGTPAARAGIRAGDVIVQVNGTAVSSIAEVRRATDPRPGTPVQVRVLRRGQPFDLTIGGD